MALSRYFRKPGKKTGKGPQVLKAMQKRYGKKQGTSVFYATINKNISSGTKAQKRVQPKTRPGAKRR